MDMQTANGKYIQVESHMLMEDATPETSICSPTTIVSSSLLEGDTLYYGHKKLTIPENSSYLAIKADKDLYFGSTENDIKPESAKRMRIPESDADYMIPVAGISEIWIRTESLVENTTATIFFGFVIV